DTAHFGTQPTPRPPPHTADEAVEQAAQAATAAATATALDDSGHRLEDHRGQQDSHGAHCDRLHGVAGLILVKAAQPGDQVRTDRGQHRRSSFLVRTIIMAGPHVSTAPIWFTILMYTA